MQEIEAKAISNLISKENRLKAVEITGFVAILKSDGKCNDQLINDVDEYVGMVHVIYEMFKGYSFEDIKLSENPIDSSDFAKLIKFHVEITELYKLAKENA
ncbi:hypothetical protein [Chryseobacterium indoltheticum]|uniref:Uncharacterized protein n=1 Tax=Chryseobacterium indoltheticum TaxID=254 RepID=A0A381FAI9_9FLAO|nr:hypothetical protein [Chryseobacterium indoltheticum]AZA73553.1 hypothetical protein EG358_07205 [Chryseobacterium indoltheticum]SIR24628.1 hypothetical protein SAMN05421682_115104 [Chryseobacterium indoltheticum]SUX43488.1 Uncharacterised protein [Chryseobacterium indoltheticum]